MTAFSIGTDRPYPDLEEAVMDLLASWYPELETRPDAQGDPDYRVGRGFPSDLVNKLPYVRVTGIGGNDDGLTDVPLLDIDVFHTTFVGARDLAGGIRGRLLRYPHRVGSTVIDRVRTAMRPHEVPWDDDRIFRFYSSYQASARR